MSHHNHNHMHSHSRSHSRSRSSSSCEQKRRRIHVFSPEPKQIICTQQYNQPWQQGQYGQQYGQQYNQQQQYGGNTDQQLRNSIDQIFMKYDRDNSGSLTEDEFRNCIGELCQILKRPPPSNYNQFINMAKTMDANYDGRISKMEVFNLFKRFGY